MGEGEDRPVARVKVPTGFDIKIEFVDPPEVAGQAQDDWLRGLGMIKASQGFWDTGCGVNSGCNSGCK